MMLVAAILLASASFITSRVGAQDAPEPGVARNENLEISVKAGFGKLDVNSWNGGWFPFRITLVNQGPPVTGRLVVHCESEPNPTSQVREYIKEIQLPTGSRQLHEIAAFLNSGQDPIIRLIANDRTLIETTIPVQRVFGFSNQLEIAVVDVDTTALNNIASTPIVRQPGHDPFKVGPRTAQPQVVAQLSGTVTPSTQGTQIPPPPPPSGPQGNRSSRRNPQSIVAHPSVVQPEDLPRDVIAYDQLDVVVLNEAPLNQLSEEQARALRLWIAAGGLLVVTGGADFAGMHVTRLDEILPIDVQSAATGTVFPLAELNQVYGPFEGNEQLLGMSARLKSGARALIGSGDRPIVAERNYGSGLVRFIAINPKLNPYRGWNGAKDLWADLALSAAEAKPRHVNWITFGARGQNSNRSGIQNVLFHLAEIGPPSAKYIIFFLIFYVSIVGPVNYALLRWKRKTDYAWLTIPAIVLLFTLVSVTVAQMSRGRNSMVADVSLVELHQRDGLANINTGVLIMPSSKGVQQTTYAGRDTYANDVYGGNQSSSASATGTIESERTAKDYTIRVPMSTWTSGLFQARAVHENQPPLVSASGNPRGAGDVMAIKNLTDAPITKVVLLSAAGVSDLFDLTPGSEQKVTLNKPQSIPFISWYTAQLGQSDDAEMFQEISGLLDREIGGDPAISQGFFETQLMSDVLKRLERPMLICFAENDPAQITFKGSFKRHSRAFYVIHL